MVWDLCTKLVKILKIISYLRYYLLQQRFIMSYKYLNITNMSFVKE